MLRRLWNVVPIYTKNLLDDRVIDGSFNRSLSFAALTAFDEYVSIRLGRGGGAEDDDEVPTDTAGRRRRKRRRRDTRPHNPTAAAASVATGSEEGRPEKPEHPPSDNDRFFEHQRTNGYYHPAATSPLPGTPEISELHRRLIPHAVSTYLREGCAAPLGPMVAHRLESGVGGDLGFDLWATVQRGRGACHPDHVHDGAIVSGVYYASVPRGSSPLLLRRPTSVHRLKNKAWGDGDGRGGGGEGEGGSTNDGGDEGRASLFERVGDGSGDVIFRPREGQLLLIPPWLYHGVPVAGGVEVAGNAVLPSTKSREEEARVSFAFNLTGSYAWGDPGDVTRVVRY